MTGTVTPIRICMRAIVMPLSTHTHTLVGESKCHTLNALFAQVKVVTAEALVTNALHVHVAVVALRKTKD